MRKKIGLYFGSFNPIHIGHLLLATHMKEAAALDEIWFIVSPQNPFKQQADLADENHRLDMVKLAVKEVDYFNVSAIEFQLEKPSYTHITLKALSKEFPEHDFRLIIGEDNLGKLQEWKEIEWISEHYTILVYNRSGSKQSSPVKNMQYFNLPLLDVSSTAIRKRIQENKSIRYFVTEDVEQFIRFHNIYR